MPLYDVTGGSGNNSRMIIPHAAVDNEYIAACKRKLHPQRWQRVIKTVDEYLEGLVAAGVNKLIWTKLGAAFGDKSVAPHARVAHLWSAVEESVGDGRNCLITFGCIFRWRIALRPETWLLWVRVTEDLDPDTGKKIKVSEYWVDQNFVPPPPKTLRSSVEALRQQWSR